MRPFDLASQANADYIDQLYRQYREDPAGLSADWRQFFAGFELALQTGARPVTGASADRASGIGVFDMVHSYRELGHFLANLDPLGSSRPPQPLLDLAEFNMTDADLDTVVGSGGFGGPTDGTLRDLIAKLKTTYCGNLGVEFIGISEKEQRDWLQAQMEPALNRPALSPEQARNVLFQLIAAEEFEQFLHTRYVGKKRFSLEGAESVIPLVNTLIDEGAPIGVENFVLGMAHRGRLNVLAHVMNKPYENILSEFEGTAYSADNHGDGDVKYHLGYSNTRTEKDGKLVKLSLQPNPSHLEFVNPVVEGIVRAKQTYMGDKDRTRVVPILLHGDAAFVGQGVVYETLSLSELPGFRTGGTIHLIVNNQIGFTTPPKQGRFTPYPTDVAKNIQAPIFHVNGDDPEAAVYAAQLAIAFRERFKCDVIIDLWCYRKYGHNETDEPAFTQPVMYEKISAKASPRTQYARKLLERGVVTQAQLDAMRDEVIARLDAAQKSAKESKVRRTPTFGGQWSGLGPAPAYPDPEWNARTSVATDTLRKIATTYATPPADFVVHPKVERFYLQSRREAVTTGKGIDWGNAEMLAMGSLLLEGFPVRFTGQDVERGTFNHRHAVLHDVRNDKTHCPLNFLDPAQKARLTISNSMLSEMAVLGFEWGYACADPRALVIWEAQFGDFVNGAQPIIDQFLTAAESKWQQSNGLVLMLPHGYEGMGPEHSNAYMERFLTLCAEDNIQVVVPTTPAQVFHALRRQIHRKFRKPLVLFQPKSLLKLPATFSRIEDLADAGFEAVLDDPGVADRAKVTRLLFCSGKVFYSLTTARDKTSQTNVAVARIEQLYPFPQREVAALVAKYPNLVEVAWVQEEPGNRGAWGYVDRRFRKAALLPRGIELAYFGRDDAASPAVGSEKAHTQEEQDLLTAALLAPTRSPEVKLTARSEPATAKGGAVSD